MSDSSTTKKRGAPLGNHNALRHGAYARRLPAPQPGQSTVMTSEKPNKQLSLVREVSYLRAYFFRLALLGIKDADPARINVTVRSLSIAATAITRLIQTGNWLLQASGSQVQYDRIGIAFQDMREFDERLSLLHKKKTTQEDANDSLDFPQEIPPAENLIPGITLVARQLGIPVSELVAGLSSPSQPSILSEVTQ